jgi:hypothetical protein
MSWSAATRKFRTPWVIVPIILLLALSLGTLWFFHNFERKEIEIHQGTSPAARNNPLLAAERYLLESGQPATNEKGMTFFSNLPSPRDAILILHLPGGLSKSISDNLIGWVEAGGHLLLMPNPLASDHPGNSNVLKQLGVKLQESEDDSNCGCPSEAEEETDSNDDAGISTEDSEDTVDTDLKGAEENETVLDGTREDEIVDEDDDYHPYNTIIDLSVEGFSIQLESFSPTLLEDTLQSAVYRIDGSYHIEYEEEEDKKREDNYEKITEDGAWLLQYKVGAGRVTVLSEMLLFSNTRIGEYDHAFFLSWLVKDSDQVWLHHAGNTESLLAILWNKFTYFWISLIMLILLSLWKLQKQSGELLRPQSENRHSIMTHIDASGQYNWRINKLSTIIESNRKTLLHWWAGRKLGHGREGIDIDLVPLAAKLGISENEINEAFRRKIGSEQDLIITSRALQKIQTLIQGGESTRNDS